MSALQSRIISARTLIAGQGAANDVRAVSDYYLGSGDKCGPQTITGESGREEDLILWNNLTLELNNSRLVTECGLCQNSRCC